MFTNVHCSIKEYDRYRAKQTFPHAQTRLSKYVKGDQSENIDRLTIAPGISDRKR